MSDALLSKMNSYKKGVTLLLRESLPIQSVDDPKPTDFDTSKRICVTDHKGVVRESVGGVFFDFPANDFFQNNNVILPHLIAYVRGAIHSRPESLSAPTHLVDTYCGSGLFSISLSSDFEQVVGVEISSTSIDYARHNAELNKLPEGRCVFHAGVAQQIFATVKDFPPDRTIVLIDPPRKGCDVSFVDQLVAFRPATIVYVSCNVHTQARDAGQIIKKSQKGGNQGYRLESLKGFDLFPQTAHVESVAVLRLIE
jgi:tRNA (uracil-5-)-methyltransferase